MIALEDLRERWIADRPLYEAWADHVRDCVKRQMRQHGIACDVTARAKEVGSLVKKAIRKNYESYESIGDKAGVRIIVTYADDVPRVEEALTRAVFVADRDDKGDELSPDTVGYRGVHYRARLRPEDAGSFDRFRDLECEVQIHTRALNLWSESSHDLSYKSPQELSGAVKRRVMRLEALVEIFDDEISATRSVVTNQQGFPEARVLDALEGHFIRLVGVRFDRELSLAIIPRLIPLVPGDVDAIDGFVGTFVETNDEKLRALYTRYEGDDRATPLLSQPEAILLFALMEHDPFALRGAWDTFFEPSLVTRLANAWGVAV